MAYRSLPRFNPEARFVANRAFLYNGHQIQPGELVANVPAAGLRKLYGMRHILMDTAPPASQHKEAAGAARKGRK